MAGDRSAACIVSVVLLASCASKDPAAPLDAGAEAASEGGPACVDPGPTLAAGDTLVVSTSVTWCNATVTANGAIKIVSGGSLLLENSTLKMAPTYDGKATFSVEGTGQLKTRKSRLESANGKAWHLDVSGQAQVLFEDTVVTGHRGIRAKDAASITASGAGSKVETLHVRDNSTVTLKDGATASVALWFTGAAATSLTGGELKIGTGMTRSFSAATAPGSMGHVNLVNAAVSGWEIDLQDAASVTVDGGENVLLALHLTGAFQALASDLTSAQPKDGSVDFSASMPPGPKLTYTATALTSVSLDTMGECGLTFSGVDDVTEANVGGAAKVTFGPMTTLAARIALAHDNGELILNGVTLREAAGPPSFTATAGSILRLTNVTPTPKTRVASVGSGRVLITTRGGMSAAAGWTKDKFEVIELDAMRVGGVFVDGVKIVP